jgi:uncharacterized protein YkuJ
VVDSPLFISYSFDKSKVYLERENGYKGECEYEVLNKDTFTLSLDGSQILKVRFLDKNTFTFTLDDMGEEETWKLNRIKK